MAQLKFSQFPIAMEAAISRHCWKKMFWEFEKQNNGKLLKIHTNSRKIPVKELHLLLRRYFQRFCPSFMYTSPEQLSMTTPVNH